MIHDLVWKGRFIVKQDGYVDLPPDRQEVTGPTDSDDRQKFLEGLNDLLPANMMFDIIKSKLRSGEINTREREDVVLIDATHEGTHWRVQGNTNASAGYFYVEARIVGDPSPTATLVITPDGSETWVEIDEADRTDPPSELMERFLDGATGRQDIDMVGVLWDILTDVRNSYKLAMAAVNVSKEGIREVDLTVLDYLTNNYGDE
jgi:hypothetical protein